MRGLRYLILSICFLSLVLMAVFFSRQSKAPHGSPHFLKQVDEHSQKLWSRLPFVQISDTNELQSYLSSIQMNEADLLSPVQQKKFYHSLALLLRAFYLGTHDAFLAFRIPKGAEYGFNAFPMESVANAWLKAHTNGETLPNNDELLRWCRTNGEDGDIVCKEGSWQGVCIDPKVIYSTIGRTNLTEETKPRAGIFVSRSLSVSNEDPFDLAITYNSGRVDSFVPFINFKFPSQHDTLLKVVSYFFVKLSTKRVLPVYIEYTWDEKSNQWLPTKLACGLNAAWEDDVNYLSF